MDDSGVVGAICGATSSGNSIYPYCLNWLCASRCLWINIFLSLDIWGRTLVLPQSDVSELVDSPQETLPVLRNGWVVAEKWWEWQKGGSSNWDWHIK